jgi:TonB-dependent SusC/RagA subfamily outer membrane receptor
MQNQTYAKQNVFRYAWLCMALVFLSSLSLFAQNLKVTGTVSDNKGEAIPGVTVVIKGSNGGTVTDINGNFAISNVPASGTLVFSFVGMKTQEVKIGNQTTIKMVLTEESIGLDEVVAVGYGTAKRRDVVGSIAKVTSEMITKNPVTSISQTLQGLASGVFVSNNSGHPGSGPDILIRGRSSINLSSGPLWIIDGIPVYTGSSQLTTQGVKPVSALSMINPNDIESIEVLKDAAATSIYGNRASGGVILVTTKSNKGGLTGVSVNYDGGMSQLPFQESDIYVDSKTWWELTDKAWANSGNTTLLEPTH